jgi:hypothetical protein
VPWKERNLGIRRQQKRLHLLMTSVKWTSYSSFQFSNCFIDETGTRMELAIWFVLVSVTWCLAGMGSLLTSFFNNQITAVSDSHCTFY